MLLAAVFAALVACGDGSGAPPVVESPTAAAQAPVRRIAAGTVVELETVTTLSSAALRRGESFALRLAAPLLVDGVELLPAGTAAVGEVVHADRSRGSGKAGELILAARYLDVAGRHVPLRRYRISATGAHRTGAVVGASFAIGPFALFMRGREIEIPPLTRGEAIVVEDVDLSVTAAATSAANP